MAVPIVLTPRAGPSFARRNLRERPAGHGRIAGASHELGEDAKALLRASLGEGTRILDAGPGVLVADFDSCTLDGRPITSVLDLGAVIREDRLGEIEGAFVVAWRDHAGDLHLARDAIGHRTAYYALHDGQLVFASHLAALLDAFGLPRRLDLRSVAAFLSCAYIPGRGTMVQGVYELLPGEQVGMQHGTLSRRTLWAMPAEPASAAATPDEEAALRTNLRAALERVIGAALPDGPVCASLSGGIDSSLVVAIARRLHRQPVCTFSITFGDQYKNELAYSSQVAAHTGSEHHVVHLLADTVIAHLDDTIARMDKPNGDPLTVPNALLFGEMSRYGDIALNGEGGDPSFGGPKNLPMLLAELYGNPDGEQDAFERERNFLRAHLKCFDELRTMLTSDSYAEACTPPLEQELAPWFHDPRWPTFVGMLMAINVQFKGGHHILPKVDALAEPFGMLPRSPLFAKSIVELAFAIPSTLKLSGSTEKYLLKESVRDLLPDSIVDRAKSGMLVPVEGWFQTTLATQARTRILDGLSRNGIFRREMLEQLLAGKNLGLRPRRGVKIWLLITLEAHLRALRIEL
ncbi:MAG: 7-cyano-7-deazaguanine synthase [Deltaproteobacteria bacterium]|nr:7-cyano-7-deazaguanine synthase [Deltaproteobacteria bacterium]MDQ3295670.1 asparagine synthetase B family protein [Myxococcota bacterium]